MLMRPPYGMTRTAAGITISASYRRCLDPPRSFRGTRAGFQHEHEAKAFLHELQERMREYELALHPAKTRLIRFGRHAAKQREELGEGKPEPFDFLGFTHFCTRSRKWGSFVIGRKTIKKRMLKQLKGVKLELRRRIDG